MVERFFELGQDPNCRVTKTGESPLLLALADYTSNKRPVIELLLKSGADPDLADEEGWTAMHSAVLDADRREVKMLLEISSKAIDAQNDRGETPLHLYWPSDTPRHGDVLASAIFRHSRWPVQIDARDKLARTPLQLVELLLRRDADKNWTEAKASTLLHSICRRKNDDLSGFVFPDASLFDRFYKLHKSTRIRMRTAGVLDVLERLEKRGYQPDRSDALTIMKLYAEYGLFEKSSSELDDQRWWFKDESRRGREPAHVDAIPRAVRALRGSSVAVEEDDEPGGRRDLRGASARDPVEEILQEVGSRLPVAADTLQAADTLLRHDRRESDERRFVQYLLGGYEPESGEDDKKDVTLVTKLG
ncbi:unnamed protein product [Trichogramma brassicae]|uniref:Uncharacterized protein n=1 Tax=Trichogramma brassicae TaxID=86971 RepID=A0A6H5IMV9_9HYME|nr:unnamed protein product [Trichogramma brassicae]